MNHRKVYFISDRTGITAATLANCLLTQFDNVQFDRINAPFVDTVEKAEQLRQQINGTTHSDRPLIFCTVVDPDVRAVFDRCNGFLVDFFDTFVNPLETELGTPSTRVAGKTHGLSDYEHYKTRIDAINYALTNDDGGSTRQYENADIVIIGVSRCGKTPTSLFLAVNHGIFAANYPLTDEDLDTDRLPAALLAYKHKLFGLTIEASRLQQIRHERKPNSRYAKPAQCNHEVQSALRIYKKNAIPYADSSHKSIEEIAAFILHQTSITPRL
ncbi:MAG: kinase/pyrophosphorylase [Gammaproteobacteria bacterium]|nr:kinase/pyrophosphorylase [Gammaproteobacteria bacterium]MDH5802902.1 kinase/pyrophosphorylase [Gammaproteobacteria bacterium]